MYSCCTKNKLGSPPIPYYDMPEESNLGLSDNTLKLMDASVEPIIIPTQPTIESSPMTISAPIVAT